MTGGRARRRTRPPAGLLVVAVLALLGPVAACGDTGAGDRDRAVDDGVVAPADGDDGTGGAADDGWHGALLDQPEPRPAFTLTDTSGEPYAFAERTAGQLTLLFFGYTSCPDICPLHLATLATALEQPGVPAPLVVFVTTDPARDTPDRLRSWLDNFGTDFVGLTGSPDEIAAAEAVVGVEGSFAVTPDGAPAETGGGHEYEVGHAAQIIAYTPDDIAHLVYPFGVQRDDWVADLPRLADGFR